MQDFIQMLPLGPQPGSIVTDIYRRLFSNPGTLTTADDSEPDSTMGDLYRHGNGGISASARKPIHRSLAAEDSSQNHSNTLQYGWNDDITPTTSVRPSSSDTYSDGTSPNTSTPGMLESHFGDSGVAHDAGHGTGASSRSLEDSSSSSSGSGSSSHGAPFQAMNNPYLVGSESADVAQVSEDADVARVTKDAEVAQAAVEDADDEEVSDVLEPLDEADMHAAAEVDMSLLYPGWSAALDLSTTNDEGLISMTSSQVQDSLPAGVDFRTQWWGKTGYFSEIRTAELLLKQQSEAHGPAASLPVITPSVPPSRIRDCERLAGNKKGWQILGAVSWLWKL